MLECWRLSDSQFGRRLAQQLNTKLGNGNTQNSSKMRQQQRARPPSPPSRPSTERREVTTRVQLSPRYKHSPKYVITNGGAADRPCLAAGRRPARLSPAAAEQNVSIQGGGGGGRAARYVWSADGPAAPPPREPRQQRTHTSQLTRTHQLRSKIYSTIMVHAST